MIAKQPISPAVSVARVSASRAMGLGLGMAAFFWLASLLLSPPTVDAAGRWPAAVDSNPLGMPGAWLGGLTWSLFGWPAPGVPVSMVLLAVGFWCGNLGWFLRASGILVVVASTGVLIRAGGAEGQGSGLLAAWVAASAEPAEARLAMAGWAALAAGTILAIGLWPARLAGWLVTRVEVSVGEARAAAEKAAKPVRKPRAAEPVPTGSTSAAEVFLANLPAATPVAAAGPDIPIHHHAAVAPAITEPPPVLAKPSADAKTPEFAGYKAPAVSILDEPEPFAVHRHEDLLRQRAGELEQAFRDYGINVRVVGINTGPVITQFELALETGLRLNKVTRLGDDIALNLRVPSVRMVAPIPGKNTVGVEIPNELRATVRLKEVMAAGAPRLPAMKIPLFLGKDNEGRALVHDLADMPHLLIAGSTGTGKSVCMNSIILSILMTRRPDEVRMIMIDPKVVELSDYGRIPHLMHPVVHDMRKAEAILSWAVDKMEERYEMFRLAKVRNIAGYNELTEKERASRLESEPGDGGNDAARMPYIVVFIDEMADLMMMMRKEVEGHIIRLAQKSRASGIHLVVATQKPTVDVITGLIKSNLPSRICFKVVNKSDSRVVLDEMGADRLLGKGDMLFLPPGTSQLARAQGTFASDGEIRRVVGSIEGDPCYAQELVQLKVRTEEESQGRADAASRPKDDLYLPAVEVVLREGRGSTSLLQRALGIGYGRAARLIDAMAEDGIVGAYNGSSARDVLMTIEQWEASKTRLN
ncbi:MAG: DNA translocase FtsK [Planctomycetes bacterium]|nr:DNA translocase FtsK [Planctomycetota bacterium]